MVPGDSCCVILSDVDPREKGPGVCSVLMPVCLALSVYSGPG